MKLDRQYLDRSAHSVLACCTCGWREMGWNDIQAWDLAVTHGAQVHNDATRAIRNLSIAQRRLRERSESC